jgi:hypothetical protein
VGDTKQIQGFAEPHPWLPSIALPGLKSRAPEGRLMVARGGAQRNPWQASPWHCLSPALSNSLHFPQFLRDLTRKTTSTDKSGKFNSCDLPIGCEQPLLLIGGSFLSAFRDSGRSFGLHRRQ